MIFYVSEAEKNTLAKTENAFAILHMHLRSCKYAFAIFRLPLQSCKGLCDLVKHSRSWKCIYTISSLENAFSILQMHSRSLSSSSFSPFMDFQTNLYIQRTFISQFKRKSANARLKEMCVGMILTYKCRF